MASNFVYHNVIRGAAKLRPLGFIAEGHVIWKLIIRGPESLESKCNNLLIFRMCYSRLLYHTHFMYYSKSERKAFPIQGWTGPEGSSRLHFPDLKTVGT